MITFPDMQNTITRICENLIEACWLSAVILTPLFFNIYSSRIFEPDKIALLNSLSVIIVCAWITLGVNNIRKINLRNLTLPIKWSEIIRKPFILPVGLMVVVYILSSIFSVNPWTSWFGSYQRSQGTLTFVSYMVIFIAIIFHLKSKEQVDRLINTIMLASIPVAMYGILQHFNLDPIPWGKDTSVRVASSLGNSIFVAAYLIMVFPLALGRFLLAIREIISGVLDKSNWLRIIFYAFICLLILTTIYFSGSRGPVLGLFASIFLFLLLLSFQWDLNKFSLFLIALAVVGALSLVLFNIGGQSFDKLRTSPVLGRFGRILDTESNTAKVRTYIWEGAVELVLPHSPIEYPDGTKDSFNSLRPFIGYGPESMLSFITHFTQLNLDKLKGETHLQTERIMKPGIH